MVSEVESRFQLVHQVLPQPFEHAGLGFVHGPNGNSRVGRHIDGRSFLDHDLPFTGKASLAPFWLESRTTTQRICSSRRRRVFWQMIRQRRTEGKSIPLAEV